MPTQHTRARRALVTATATTALALTAPASVLAQAQGVPPPTQAVVWQDGRAVPASQTGPNAYSVSLRNGPFSITIPNRDPAGQPIPPGRTLIGVCLSRDPALFTGIATGRSVGVMPCLNGAAAIARDENETAANMALAVSDSGLDGDGHFRYDEQNTVFTAGAATLHAHAIHDHRTVGVTCKGKGYGQCRDMVQTQPFAGGTLHAIVYTDLNENRLADAGEYWLLTLRLDGPPPKSASTTRQPPEPAWGPLGRPLARLNGTEVLYLADAQAEQRRQPGSRESGDLLAKALARLADQVLAGQEAVRLGLWAGPSAALAASPDVAARANDRLQGAQRYAQHIAAATPAPSDAQVRTYHDTWPELFSQRKVYRLEQFVPEPGHLQVAGLALEPGSIQSPIRMAAFLAHHAVPFRRSTVTMAAESLPLASLRELARLPVGTGMALDLNGQPTALFVLEAQSRPVPFDVARPHIETFLHNQARRTAVDQAIQRLATAAKFEQFGPVQRPASAAP